MRQLNPNAALRKPPASQLIEGTTSRCAIQRIIAALEEGQPERSIARSEGITERLVQRVRTFALDRAIRHEAAWHMAESQMQRLARDLQAQLDRDAINELLEVA